MRFIKTIYSSFCVIVTLFSLGFVGLLRKIVPLGTICNCKVYHYFELCNFVVRIYSNMTNNVYNWLGHIFILFLVWVLVWTVLYDNHVHQGTRLWIEGALFFLLSFLPSFLLQPVGHDLLFQTLSSVYHPTLLSECPDHISGDFCWVPLSAVFDIC